jgi:hypoxanthine phosphoribosyltransferase
MESAEVLLSEEQIRKRVAELGAQISSDVGGEMGGSRLHVVAVLDNGFMFMSDLVRSMKCKVICQFIKMETHDLLQDGHERRQILYTPIVGIKDNDFLLVDAVLHTGVTLDHLIQQFLSKGARSVKTAVLIDKPEERRVNLNPDYWGFQITGRYLVGYGLGHHELSRNLPYVADLKPEGNALPARSENA